MKSIIIINIKDVALLTTHRKLILGILSAALLWIFPFGYSSDNAEKESKEKVENSEHPELVLAKEIPVFDVSGQVLINNVDGAANGMQNGTGGNIGGTLFAYIVDANNPTPGECS